MPTTINLGGTDLGGGSIRLDCFRQVPASTAALILRFDGSGGTIVDSSENALAVTAVNGAAQNAAAAKFGAAGLRLANASNHRLSIANTGGVLNLGNADFLFRWWMNISGIDAFAGVLFGSGNNTSGGNAWKVLIEQSGNYDVLFETSVNGSGTTRCNTVSPNGVQVPGSGHVHWAVGRFENNLRIYKNGTMVAGPSACPDLSAYNGNPLIIGSDFPFTGTNSADAGGDFDDFVVHVGENPLEDATSYTVPTGPLS